MTKTTITHAIVVELSHEVVVREARFFSLSSTSSKFLRGIA
jgi:hypothetical protein